jgi:hypothetical protein
MLGLEVERDRRAGEISVRQAAKAKGLAEAFGVAGDRRTIPMSSAVYGSLKCAKPGDEMADKTAYQSGIGSLLHMAQCVRPDIAAPVGALAAFGSAPTAVHFAAMLAVIGYVGATAERGISYRRSDVAFKIWCDANFAACMDTRHSWSGWVVVCFGGPVSWESCKQPTAGASTIEAEYQACGAVAREGLSFRKLLRECDVFCEALKLSGPLMIHCDNKAVLSLCSDRKETKRATHIDVVHHFARDHVASGELFFRHVKSDNNIADCLTKALPRPLFQAGLIGLGVLE